MQSCSSCHLAQYCSVTCQRGAWKAHKVQCKKFQSYAADIRQGRMPNVREQRLLEAPQGAELIANLRGHTFTHRYLVHIVRVRIRPHLRAIVNLRFALNNVLTSLTVVQPDRPVLCKFWLESIINGLEISTGLDSASAFATLILFLWVHTWVAVPEYLRTPLLEAVAAHADMLRAERTDAWREDPLHDLLHRRCGRDGALGVLKDRLESAWAVFRVLREDPAFVAWRRVNPMPPAFQHYEAVVTLDSIHTWASRCCSPDIAHALPCARPRWRCLLSC